MELIGHKTTALLDIWSLCHFIFGASVGNTISRIIRDRNKQSTGRAIRLSAFLLILSLAFIWEFLEYGLEKGIAGYSVAYWFQGQEHWSNRLLGDPVMMLAGYIFSLNYRVCIWPARMILIFWMWLFVFVCPNSMSYL